MKQLSYCGNCKYWLKTYHEVSGIGICVNQYLFIYLGVTPIDYNVKDNNGDFKIISGVKAIEDFRCNLWEKENKV